MKKIHQLVAGFTNGDAISNEAGVMRSIFRKWGYESEIFSELKRILPELRKDAREAEALAASCSPDDIALCHLSIGSKVNDIFKSLPCKKAILYHNVTPSHYLELIHPQMAHNLALGRKQIESLAGIAEVNMADSKFNAIELEESGYKNVKVLPLVLDLDKLKDGADRRILRKYDDDKVNILFVGRCVPNKKIEDLVMAFYYFNKYVEPNSRLIHVGSHAGTERYYYLLLTMIKELQLDNVHFAKSVPQRWLNAYYQCSNVFLSMSEHEGFCIPVIEAMEHNLPVMAYEAAAVPETLDGAGILFKEKDYRAIAELMGELTRNQGLRNSVLEKQRSRLSRYKRRDLEAELKEHLAPVLAK